MYIRKSYFACLLVGLLGVNLAFADGLNRREYSDRYALKSMDSEYGKDVKKCLAAWGNKSPFKNVAKLRFRVIEPDVALFGLGKDVADRTRTTYPQIVLIKSAVNVMGKSNMHLLNPNGWYCLEGKVTVMGKTTINLACKASLASTDSSTVVLGKQRGKGNAGGSTVMGKTVIKRNCPK